MQDDLTNEIARVLVETQAATVENRALALRPLIAREVAAQKERDAVIARATCAKNRHLSLGDKCAAAIRSAG